jgi:serine/threonine-protein phosphatase 2A regulatory subunit B'
MVYNAMKLFMEVNPQLFDDCSHEYTETQNNAESVKAARQAKWDRLSALAEKMKAGNGPSSGGMNGVRSVQQPSRGGDGEMDSQQRMERLRLGDEGRRNPAAIAAAAAAGAR